PTSCNSLEVITDGLRYKELFTDDLLKMSEGVEIECLLFGDDAVGHEVKEMLVDKVLEGAHVRYMHEPFGNFFDSFFDNRPVLTGFYLQMERDGIDKRNFITPYKTFCHTRNLNHRKISVIDGGVAYTGGMNITQGSMGSWGDTHIRVTGPAASDLRAIFFQNWNAFRGNGGEAVPLAVCVAPEQASRYGIILQTVADGPDVPAHTCMEAVIWALDHASSYIYFQTPYFCPPQRVVKAMKRAAERGVDVRIIIPGACDISLCDPVNRSYYKTLTKSGVKVYQREQFNHSKVFVCDDYLGCIGSSNLDWLSMRYLYEINTFLYDSGTASRMKANFLERAEESELVTDETIKGWSAGEKMLQGVSRLLIPVL
ncbi:MAG: phosphatidylserine/phosphatidylglycerophosphate/cardiolipin synthase family protein, partial [Bacteroidales bacterium]|nr:phosphatidylserine/phosphatidylglycerophosphate/cardiolipin synthase family protein [Bacteroidales bacterium]